MSRSSKDLFPSKFLKSEDIGTNRPIVTIARVEIEPVGKGKDQVDKAICYFAEPKFKPIVLNKTNCETIEEIAGTDDLDSWPGVRIQLYATKVDFGGKRVDGLRVSEPPARSAVKPAPVSKPAGSKVKAAVALAEDEIAETDATAEDDVF